MDAELRRKCEDYAWQIRRDIVDMTYSLGTKGAHIGGSLSVAEILAVLYAEVLSVDPNSPDSEDRDRLILSKGHAAMALYSAMAHAGLFSVELLTQYKQDGGLLSGHPSLNGLPGIDYASGSLGQGLSLGVGTCIGLNRKHNKGSRVYVILGDGECDEGSVWEAAASAVKFGLGRLIAIVDKNRLQYDGDTAEVLDMSPFAEKWKSFGWNVLETDGHDVEKLYEAFEACPACDSTVPTVIIANTVKGKGISYMENNPKYHNSWLSEQLYKQAVDELEKQK